MTDSKKNVFKEKYKLYSNQRRVEIKSYNN